MATAASTKQRAASPGARRTKPAPTDKKGRNMRSRDEDRPDTGDAEAQPAGPLQGTGKFVFPNGSVYAGEWQMVDDVKRRHGHGRFQHGQELYIGDWSNDTMHGRGRFEFAQGCVYEGEWAHGRFHGRGTYSWPSGASYTGDWACGKMHGQGLFVASDGQRYQGRFHNDYFVNAEGQWLVPQPDAGAGAGAVPVSSGKAATAS